jgi:cytochrome c oxidase assembly protein subunit 15
MAVAEFPVLLSARADAGMAPARAVRPVRLYFLLLFVLGLAAFIFGVQARFPAGLFLYPPPVDWLPPLSGAQWLAAFAAHQQDPIFAACGGAQSLGEFQTLYWWEWLRQASLLLVVAGATAAFIGVAAMRQFRFALPRLVGLGLLVLAYAVVRWLVGLAAGNVDELARFNVGQYRHAVDVTFASAVVAAVLTSALGPPPAGTRRFHLAAWLWGGALLLDIAFGALFMARDATAVWPGLGDVPPLVRFVSYDPLWLNVLFNPYAIQLAHRALSGGLWIAALGYFVSSVRRNRSSVTGAAVLFGLMTAQMALGIATLVLGVQPALSLLHRVGGVLLLAAAFALVSRFRSSPEFAARPEANFGIEGH